MIYWKTMRGLALTEEELNNMLAKLKPILQTGVSLFRAVRFWNVENENDYIPYYTLRDYRKKSYPVRRKIQGWQDYPTLLARVTVGKALPHDPKLALEYLKRRESKLFGDKIESTGTIKVENSKDLDLSSLNEEELLQWQALTAKISKGKSDDNSTTD